MANVLKHKFTSVKPDDPDASLVRPSNWNEEHVFANGFEDYYLKYSGAQSDHVVWDNLWVRFAFLDISKPPYNAIGDGVAINTLPLQQALDDAALQSKVVYIPNGSFKTANVRVKNGCRGVVGPGLLLDTGNAGQGLLEFDGTFFSTTPVDNCTVSTNFDISNGQIRALFLTGSTRCNIIYCTVNGIQDAVNHEGIRLHGIAAENNILFNKVFAANAPVNNVICINLSGTLTDIYGGYFASSGAFVIAPQEVMDNRVIGNYCIGGTHNIILAAAARNIIAMNSCVSGSHRAIELAPQTRYNLITNNSLREWRSSAVIMAYNALGNHVESNQCISTAANGEAALQAYVGVSGNVFRNNYVDMNASSVSCRYGIYTAINSINNSFENNYVSGYTLAGIAVEGDWESPLPGGALYSRPNFAPPPVGSVWAFNATQAIVIRGNIVSEPKTLGAGCGIYLAQIGATIQVNGVQVIGNTVYGAPLDQFFLFEETSGVGLISTRAKANTFTDVNPAAYSFTRGKAHFLAIDANDYLNDFTFTFADADTTPSIAVGDRFECNNTGATSITDFDDGADGFAFELRLDVNTTIVHNNALIRLKGGVNITPGTSNNFVKFRMEGGVWFEIYRNF